jgi:aspartyl-tRNA synthetase
MSFDQRTQYCGELNLKHVGQKVTLNGWAHKVRNLGGLLFIDLRDRTGISQIVFHPEQFQIDQLNDIKPESCLSITGTVQERSESNKNSKMATGDIELVATQHELLNSSTPLPFPVGDEEQMKQVNEELRVKHRYLDLRRPSMYNKLALRAAVIRKIRQYLDDQGFIETETPIFTKTTPEGARDYIVPYRLKPGLFYALPQSPQQYKQLLMVAGIDKYYQICRCFRDEAHRSDRLPEFTQLDLEMSFVTQEDILQLIEGMTIQVINETIKEFKLEKDPIKAFPRISYDDAMRHYGCDKPDLRFDLQLFDISSAVAQSDFGVFKNTIDASGCVRGVRFPGGAQKSRKEIQELEEYCKSFGAKGMAYFIIEQGTSESGYSSPEGLFAKGPIAKFFKPEELNQIFSSSKAQAGDLLCLIADQYNAGNNVLYRLRNKIGDLCNLRDKRKLEFCWIVDFPLVEWDEDNNKWTFTHHPFAAPKETDIDLIDVDPGRIRSYCYDIVCNGTEWASGSLRIHNAELQRKVFNLLGIGTRIQDERFGHLLEAFQYGAPPHGGIAPGIDRLLMFLTDEENIREVIAFPKVAGGYDPMMGSPSEIDIEQWHELGLSISKTE